MEGTYLDPKYFPKDIKEGLLDKYQQQLEVNGKLLVEIIRYFNLYFVEKSRMINELNEVLKDYYYSRFIRYPELEFIYDSKDHIDDKLFINILDVIEEYIVNKSYFAGRLNNMFDNNKLPTNIRAIYYQNVDEEEYIEFKKIN